ncbi:acetyltransferase [Fulvivirga ligni]|uniref:acetyltransferase n=1 Tax=Fulvivirga ligni TaxID=2904246 RepID=UPI001F353642|nr:acetyltransferase [Fulvivirga ligni]UII23889.1 acetyltransferase [Fulvivirga ligni]
MYLFGASGHAKVILDILKLTNQTVKGFYDDDPNKKELWGIPVLGHTDDFEANSGDSIITIGNNKIRKKVTEQISSSYGKAVHPTSVIAETVKVGQGTVVMANVTVNPDTQIGSHVILNTSSSIDHDCILEDFVHIAPNSTLCGGIKIGEGTLIGSGSVVIPNITVGKWVTIGAGCVVTEDIPDYAVVVGNPGKIIKYNR